MYIHPTVYTTCHAWLSSMHSMDPEILSRKGVNMTWQSKITVPDRSHRQRNPSPTIKSETAKEGQGKAETKPRARSRTAPDQKTDMFLTESIGHSVSEWARLRAEMFSTL
ncbi:hypothetical protein NEUTE2DRAFT_147059 [Neurospora tetrasperma FGSC 2509]|nr:hypothetical protein NEUTE2DRAFT_147059 [Neurospora tetrasperma FGSC 2509]